MAAELVTGIPTEWIGSRIGMKEFGPCETMGLLVNGILMVGLIWCDYKPAQGSISMCLAVDDARGITKGILRQVFEYAFLQVGVNRITNTCSTINTKAMAVNRRAGFTLEGIMRQAYPDGTDMAVFGMLKGECKYLEQ